MKTLQSALAPIHAHWQRLAPQERRLIGIAGLVVSVALLWWVALAPALQTLRTAPQAHAQLDQQLQQMRALQAQARNLQSQPKLDRPAAVQALETSLKASLQGQAAMQANAGGSVAVTLQRVPADALAGWLSDARANARAIPRELRLTRSVMPAESTPVAAPAPEPTPTPARPALRPGAAIPVNGMVILPNPIGPPNRNTSLPRTPEAEGAAPNTDLDAGASSGYEDENDPPATAAPATAPTLAAAPQPSAPAAAPSQPAAAAIIHWDGTLLLALPAP